MKLAISLLGLELLATTPYPVPEFSSVGVPLMTPVDVSKASPSGSVPVNVQEVAVPPVFVGVIVAGVPLVKTYGFPV